jgi:hypothetical protein
MRRTSEAFIGLYAVLLAASGLVRRAQVLVMRVQDLARTSGLGGHRDRLAASRLRATMYRAAGMPHRMRAYEWLPSQPQHHGRLPTVFAVLILLLAFPNYPNY